MRCRVLTGFEVPNVGHLFFVFFLFLCPHLSFQSHIPPSFFKSRSREAFFKPQRRPTPASLFYFALRLHSQPPALLWSVFLLCPSGFLCVGNSVTKSPFHLSSIAGDHRVPGSTKTPPVNPCKRTCPFSKRMATRLRRGPGHSLFPLYGQGLSQEPQHAA